ncbi:MAG: glycosyltransferase [Bacteroidales bacterium]|jgi:glycosyltransferase involved in cell wall biosynthesis|nr:glycosyltransferase [Bacteroidales bacterium]
MNLLFINNAEVSPFSNGIQRVTHLLSQAFAAEGINCYSAFYFDNPATEKTPFTIKLKLQHGQEYEVLSRFIADNKIKFIICQEVLGNKRLFKNIRRAAANSCKLLYCLHTTPLSAFVSPNTAAEFFRILHKNQILRSLKKLTVGLLPHFAYNWLVFRQKRKEFSILNECFDRIVLLSEKYIDDWRTVSALPANDRHKVIAIPNALVFDAAISDKDLDKKQHEILIVARLSDRQKRISTALQIWEKAQQNVDVKNWKLTILGTGEDEAYYKHLVKKYKIKAISFDGVQNPIEYYRRASIFMMTSAYEGFPMTLIEAQQMGAVPILFNNFGAAHDIVEKDFSGIIIEKDNFEEYMNQLIMLMCNTEKLQILAKNAIESCKQFSTENIVSKWIELFNTYLTK